MPLIATKVWAVAHYDTSTALAILQNASITDLFIGISLDLLPFVLRWAVIFLAGYVAFRIAWGHVRLSLIFATPLVTVVGLQASGYTRLSIFDSILLVHDLDVWPYGPIAYLAGLLLATTAGAVAGIMAKKQSKSEPLTTASNGRRVAFAVLFATFGLLLAVGVTSTNPWLPPERIVLDGQPMTVFVLSEEDDTYVILTIRRVPLRVEKASITDRAYCYIEDFSHQGPRDLEELLPPCPLPWNTGPFAVNRAWDAGAHALRRSVPASS